MRPLILMPTINSRNSNACYLQLLSVHRDASTPHRQSAAAGGGSRPPQQQSAAAGGGGPTPPAAERTGPSSPASSPPPPPLRPRFVFKRYSYARGGCVRRAFEPNTPREKALRGTRQCRSVEQHSVSERRASISSLIIE